MQNSGPGEHILWMIRMMGINIGMMHISKIRLNVISNVRFRTQLIERSRGFREFSAPTTSFGDVLLLYV